MIAGGHYFQLNPLNADEALAVPVPRAALPFAVDSVGRLEVGVLRECRGDKGREPQTAGAGAAAEEEESDGRQDEEKDHVLEHALGAINNELDYKGWEDVTYYFKTHAIHWIVMSHCNHFVPEALARGSAVDHHLPLLPQVVGAAKPLLDHPQHFLVRHSLAHQAVYHYGFKSYTFPAAFPGKA